MKKHKYDPNKEYTLKGPKRLTFSRVLADDIKGSKYPLLIAFLDADGSEVIYRFDADLKCSVGDNWRLEEVNPTPTLEPRYVAVNEEGTHFVIYDKEPVGRKTDRFVSIQNAGAGPATIFMAKVEVSSGPLFGKLMSASPDTLHAYFGKQKFCGSGQFRIAKFVEVPYEEG